MEQDKIIEKIVEKLPVEEVYSDLVKPSFVRLGKVGDDILKFIALPFSFLGMTAEELEEKYKIFIGQAINKVPESKRVVPSPVVAGPLLEHVKYVFDEDKENILQKMFAELLGNACNIDFKDYVQPSYIHTLKQLTWAEAKILQCIYNYNEDIRCYGVSFQQICTVEKDHVLLFSDEAEPLFDFDHEGNTTISNVFYEYYIPLLKETFGLTERKLRNSLAILVQLNMLECFVVNKYKDKEKYSLEKHDKKNVDVFDSLKGFYAYRLTGYAYDLLELCVEAEQFNNDYY